MHEIQIEVLLLSVSRGDQLRWRVVGGDLPPGRANPILGRASSPA